MEFSLHKGRSLRDIFPKKSNTKNSEDEHQQNLILGTIPVAMLFLGMLVAHTNFHRNSIFINTLNSPGADVEEKIGLNAHIDPRPPLVIVPKLHPEISFMPSTERAEKI